MHTRTFTRRSSLDLKVIGSVFLTMVVGMTFFGWYLASSEREAFSEQMRAHADSLTRAASIFSLEPLLTQDFVALENYTKQLANRGNSVAFVRIQDEKGQVVAQSPKESIIQKIDPNSVQIHQADVRLDQDRRFGSVTIGISTQNAEAFISGHIRILILVAGFLFLMLAVTVTLLLKKTVIQPVGFLSDRAESLGEGDLDTPILSSSRDELGHLAYTLDVMRQRLKQSYEKIIVQQDKLTTIILSAQEGIVVANRDGDIVLTNPASERLLEKNSEEIIQQGFLNLLDNPGYLQKYLSSDGIELPDTIVLNNRVLQIHASTIECPVEGKIGSAVFLRDVTEEKRLQEQLQRIATTDALTGLNNRRHMDELLDQELSRARRYGTSLGVFMFDVDHFKKFNDTYGHDQGDRVLEAIGKKMSSLSRPSDFPCRYGGEEFCMILAETNREGSIAAAERARLEIERLVVDTLKVTISVGLAIFPEHDVKNPKELIKLADNALYEAKRGGRNRVCIAQPKNS